MKCAYCGNEIPRKVKECEKLKSKNLFCCMNCQNLFRRKTNKILNKGDYSELIVERKGQILHVLIDNEDIKKIQNYWWSATIANKGSNKFYITTRERGDNKNRRTIRLHRFLMDCPDNMQIDHINRNSLDNRKCNLRIVTQQENANNKGDYKNNTSGYKYITYHKTNKVYCCVIKRNNKRIFQKSRKNLMELVKLRDEFLEKLNNFTR